MGIGTILSHGISSYMGTKNAMEERDARRAARQREQDRHEAWKDDRAVAAEDRKTARQREQEKHDDWKSDAAAKTAARAERGAYYADLQALPPRLLATASPAVAEQQPATGNAPDAPPAKLEEPWNGVVTLPYQDIESQIDVGAIEPGTENVGRRTPLAPPSAVQNSAVVARHGVKRPEVPPPDRARPAPTQPAPAKSTGQQDQLAALSQAKQRLDVLRARASKMGDATALNLLNERGQALLGEWAASFEGDPTQNPLGYAEHLGRAGALFGKPLTPDEAAKIHAMKRAYEAEGAIKALEFAHRGDRAGALAAYNAHGRHQFADVQLVPAKSLAGLPSYNIIGINADGSRENLGNAFDSMAVTAGWEQQLKNFIDLRKANSEIGKNDAAAVASRASAGNSAANAEQTRLETKIMRETGVKPGSGGGSGGLTIPQQRTNASIDAARQQIAGMSQAEILKRTQTMIGSGRDNPNYAPGFAAVVRMARTRKYGEDPDYEAAIQGHVARPAQPGSPSGTSERGASSSWGTPKPTPRARFEADPGMRGYKMGKPTGRGWEVLDQSGSLIGYWN